MIPYEELCDALARWRHKNGLGVGSSARQAPRAPASAPPAAAAFVPATTSPQAEAPDEDRTSANIAALPPAIEASAPPRDEPTGEIDVDSLEVMEEEPV